MQTKKYNWGWLVAAVNTLAEEEEQKDKLRVSIPNSSSV